jgi:alkylhydroperoxidase family enzyme
MYLDDVQNHQPAAEAGRFGRVIESGRKTGQPIPEIYHLFAYRPRAAQHLGHLMQEIMRGEGALPAGWRELIAAWTSARNHCLF